MKNFYLVAKMELLKFLTNMKTIEEIKYILKLYQLNKILSGENNEN